jgi:hypothetical protein
MSFAPLHAVVVGAPGVALAEGSSALGGSGGSALESPLVVAEAQSLVGGEGVSAAEEARRDNPEAVAFAGSDDAQAAKVDVEAFPGLLDDPAGGPAQKDSGWPPAILRRWRAW